MDDITSKSPASVATDLVSSHMEPDKIQGPPMFLSKSDTPLTYSRSSSMPEDIQDGTTAAANSTSKDDIETSRRPRPTRQEMMATLKSQGSSNLSISESTRKILERMSTAQVHDATLSYEKVQQTRRVSGLDNIGSILQKKKLSIIMDGSERSGGVGERRRSSGLDSLDYCLEGELKDIESMKFDDDAGAVQRRSSGSRRSSDENSKGSSAGERLFSKSVGAALGGGGTALGDFDEEEESSEFDESDRTGEQKLGDKGERNFSKSLGAMGESNTDVPPSSSSLFDDPKDGNVVAGRDGGLEEVQAIADETFQRIIRKHSGSDHSTVVAGNATLPQPKSQRRSRGTESTSKEEEFKPEKIQTRRPGRQRRAGMMSQSCSAASKTKNAGGGNMASSLKGSSVWKPLSSDQSDFLKADDEDEGYDSDEENRKQKASGMQLQQNQQQRGLGGLWNKLTASFTGEGPPPDLLNNPPPSSPKSEKGPRKDVDGATYFRRGKRRANKCQFLQAVALFNFALVRQREELGENHIDCATTLNEIGVCWMMLGERYPALTAFEEALFIRQQELGDGAMEVAETTNNIWMILHEERQEMKEHQAAASAAAYD